MGFAKQSVAPTFTPPNIAFFGGDGLWIAGDFRTAHSPAMQPTWGLEASRLGANAGCPAVLMQEREAKHTGLVLEQGTKQPTTGEQRAPG